MRFGLGQNALGDTGRSTNKNDIINLVLLDFRVFEDLFDGLQGLLKEVHVQF